VKQLNQARVDDLAKLASLVLEALINDELKTGLTIPRITLGSLVDPVLSFGPRRVIVDTDFQADRNELSKIAQRIANREITKFVG